MTCRKIYIQEIARQLSRFLATGSVESLITYLVAESGRPGPCANRDLIAAFADTVREYAAADEGDCRALWSLCTELACVSPEDAPADNPHESLRSAGFSASRRSGPSHPHLPKWHSTSCRMPPSTPVSG